MAYDEDLAERVRSELRACADFSERKMFGGLAFMVNTHMACGIMSQGLMVRVGKDNHSAALTRGAVEMTFTGRPMRGMVIVTPENLQDGQLTDWVVGAVDFALSEPPESRK